MTHGEGGTFLIIRECWIRVLTPDLPELASFSLSSSSFFLILKMKPNNNAFHLYQSNLNKMTFLQKGFILLDIIHPLVKRKGNCPEKYVRGKYKYGWRRKKKFLKKTTDGLLTMNVKLCYVISRVFICFWERRAICTAKNCAFFQILFQAEMAIWPM